MYIKLPSSSLCLYVMAQRAQKNKKNGPHTKTFPTPLEDPYTLSSLDLVQIHANPLSTCVQSTLFPKTYKFTIF